jgi:hypothetical protein
VDKGYVIASIRQQLLAAGCLLQEDRAKATYVVEARAGAIGTDRSELMFGIPQMNIPGVVPGMPGGMIPEIPLAKRTDKRGVAKLAVVAYNRQSGQAVWQSGVNQALSSSKETWVFGAGPFQHGTVLDGTEVGGQVVQVPLTDEKPAQYTPRMLPATQAAAWAETPQLRPAPESSLAQKQATTMVDPATVPASGSSK